MKLRLSILLLAAALAAAPAAGQTIKSLGYNTTNGNIVAATNVTFTNSVGFATNARAATRTNLGGTTVGNALFTAATTNAARVALGATVVGENIFTVPLQYQELFLRINADNTVSSLSPAATRTNLGLGASNNVVFKELTLNGAGLLVNESGFFSLTVTTNFGGINFVNGTTPMFTLTGSLATFATNVTVGGTLGVTGNSTLSGVNNTMPNATNAASGASLMTRDLVDARALNAAINTMPNLRYTGITAAGGTVLDSSWNTGVYTAATTNAIGFGRLNIPHDSIQFGSDLAPFKFWVFTRIALSMATNASNSVTFGVSGTTNSTEFPVQSATSTNPAYVSFGTNLPNDNRYAVQLRRDGSDLQARFIAMRQASPSGVYFETAWTNILSGFSGASDLVTRPVIIALNRNGTNVSAYFGNTDTASPYEDFNSLTLLGSHTLSTATASDFGIAFRAVSISGDPVRAEFLNTSAVLTP